MNNLKEYIDGNYTYLRAQPALYGVIATISALSLEENFVGRITNLKIGIMTRTDMTTDALIDVYFPDQFSLPNSAATLQTCAVTLGNKR